MFVTVGILVGVFVTVGVLVGVFVTVGILVGVFVTVGVIALSVNVAVTLLAWFMTITHAPEPIQASDHLVNVDPFAGTVVRVMTVLAAKS